MRFYGLKQVSKLTLVAIAIAFILGLANPALAQRNDAYGNVAAGRDNDRSVTPNHDQSYEASRSREVQKLALMQIKEDFSRIQIVNRDLQRTAFVEKSPDLKRISEMAADINKRAKRLKNYLSASASKEKNEKAQKYERAPADGTQLKESLGALDKLIISFVENPVFKQPDKPNPQQKARADSDIIAIVEISDTIRKGAEKLNKAP